MFPLFRSLSALRSSAASGDPKEYMKPPAIEAPEISEAEIVNRWDLATGREERAEKTLAESRLEKGRILVAARKMYPPTGNDGRWSKLLGKLRVESSTAWRYMQLAGATEDASCTVQEAGTIPTYAEAGIVKQPSGYQSSVTWERAHRQEPREIDFTPSRAIVAPVVSEHWADDMEGLAEQMIRASRSLFSAAEQLDALCRQRQATISANRFASIPTHLLAAQAAIAATLRLFNGEES